MAACTAGLALVVVICTVCRLDIVEMWRVQGRAEIESALRDNT